MPAFYKIDKERKLVMSTGSGVYTMADALAHQDKLLKDPDFDRSFSQLYDFTHITDIELSSEDIRTLARSTVFFRKFTPGFPSEQRLEVCIRANVHNISRHAGRKRDSRLP
jgi:hypothetical protein